MLSTRTLRRGSRAAAFAAVALLPMLAACPRKTAPVEDAGPPAISSSSSSASSVTELVPLVEDAGPDADAQAEAEAPKKHAAPSVITANQAKIKACCHAMHAQAKQLGASSPEGYQLETMAGQCDAFAAQVGPGGTAPELNQFREILKSLKLPAACEL